jgi:serine phosphatase RsbU (regulator of sigma subunit)
MTGDCSSSISVNAHLLSFTGGAPQSDDITMVAVRFNPA